MIGTDILLTTAELSLALGGFGSLVATFLGDRERWDPMAVVRFRALIAISLGSALLALVPLPIDQGGLHDAALWTVSSSLAAAFVTVILISMIVYARAPMMRHGSRFWSLIAVLLASGSVAINSFNALGIGFSRSFTGYYCALLLQIFLAGLYFFRLIVLSGPQAALPPRRDEVAG